LCSAAWKRRQGFWKQLLRASVPPMGFSIQTTLSFAWETFKKRPWLFVGATLLLGIAQILVEGFGEAFKGLPENLDPVVLMAVGLIGSAIYFALSTLIAMGMTAFFLAGHDDPETVKLSALWHPRPFWKYLGVTLLFALIVLAAIALLMLFNLVLSPVLGFELSFAVLILVLIIFGAIFWLAFMFAGFLVIDREVGPVEAFKESYRITNGHKGTLFGLTLTLFLINLVGVLVLLVGLLVSVPVTLLALTHAYRVLSGTDSTPPDEAMDAKLAA